MFSSFKTLIIILFGLLLIAPLAACSGEEEPKPNIYVDPNVQVLYLNDLELQGKVHFLDLKAGEYVALGSNVEQEDYSVNWTIISGNPDIVFVNPPVYEEKYLASYFGLTAMNEGHCIVSLKETDGSNVTYLDITVSR